MYQKSTGCIVVLSLLVWVSGCSTSYSYKPGNLPAPWESGEAHTAAADSNSTVGKSVDAGGALGHVVAVGDQARILTTGGEVYDGEVVEVTDSLALITDRIEPSRSLVRIPMAEIVSVEIGVPGQLAGEKNFAVVVLAALVGIAVYVAVLTRGLGI